MLPSFLVSNSIQSICPWQVKLALRKGFRKRQYFLKSPYSPYSTKFPFSNISWPTRWMYGEAKKCWELQTGRKKRILSRVSTALTQWVWTFKLSSCERINSYKDLTISVVNCCQLLDTNTTATLQLHEAVHKQWEEDPGTHGWFHSWKSHSEQMLGK